MFDIAELNGTSFFVISEWNSGMSVSREFALGKWDNRNKLSNNIKMQITINFGEDLDWFAYQILTIEPFAHHSFAFD